MKNISRGHRRCRRCRRHLCRRHLRCRRCRRHLCRRRRCRGSFKIRTWCCKYRAFIFQNSERLGLHKSQRQKLKHLFRDFLNRVQVRVQLWQIDFNLTIIFLHKSRNYWSVLFVNVPSTPFYSRGRGMWSSTVNSDSTTDQVTLTSTPTSSSPNIIIKRRFINICIGDIIGLLFDQPVLTSQLLCQIFIEQIEERRIFYKICKPVPLVLYSTTLPLEPPQTREIFT